MAKDETFMLISLEDNKAKKLAQAISSDTSRIILDALTSKDHTETELSNQLGLPISTVHYNLKQLTESGLVVSKEFHYSEKGKEVNHYSLANKFIIIAPKFQQGFSVRIRKILPAALSVAAIAGAVSLLQRATTQTLLADEAKAMTAGGAAPVAAPIAARLALQPQLLQPQIPWVAWFLLGALLSLALVLLWDWVSER